MTHLWGATEFSNLLLTFNSTAKQAPSFILVLHLSNFWVALSLFSLVSCPSTKVHICSHQHLNCISEFLMEKAHHANKRLFWKQASLSVNDKLYYNKTLTNWTHFSLTESSNIPLLEEPSSAGGQRWSFCWDVPLIMTSTLHIKEMSEHFWKYSFPPSAMLFWLSYCTNEFYEF